MIIHDILGHPVDGLILFQHGGNSSIIIKLMNQFDFLNPS